MIAYCFPGQGSQEVGMGRAFAESVPGAAAVFEDAAAATGLDLARLCFEGPLEELTETEVLQPALATTSLACLAAVEERLGPRASFVVGHSVGEYAALAACGALAAPDAIALVRERGRVTAEAARRRPGAMAAVLGLSDEEVEEICAGLEEAWPANYNCPGQVVVSGSLEAVDRFSVLAEERGARRVVRLRVTGAFHSPLVAPAGPALRPALAGAAWREPTIPFVSAVTAQVEPLERYVDLLVEQLTAPVRFTQAVRTLLDAGVRTFVEIGPGQVLAGLIRRIDRGAESLSVGDPSSLDRLEEVLRGR